MFLMSECHMYFIVGCHDWNTKQFTHTQMVIRVVKWIKLESVINFVLGVYDSCFCGSLLFSKTDSPPAKLLPVLQKVSSLANIYSSIAQNPLRWIVTLHNGLSKGKNVKQGFIRWRLISLWCSCTYRVQGTHYIYASDLVGQQCLFLL